MVTQLALPQPEINSMKRKDYILIVVAAIIALVAPTFFLARLIYPAFKIFGSNYLMPVTRIVATILMAVVDYALAYIFIYKTPKRKKILFNSVAFLLTFLWNVAIGVLWWITID